MLTTIIVLAILAIAYLAFTLYISPRKVRAHYMNLFKSKGYKVREFPYTPFAVPPFYKEMINAAKEKKDFFFYHRT